VANKKLPELMKKPVRGANKSEYMGRTVFGPKGKEYIQRGDKSSVDVQVTKGTKNWVDKKSHPTSSITVKARHRPVKKGY
jgi:hypothetical protein